MQVTRDSGILVPAINPKQSVSDMATAMRTLANDKELRHRMGIAGREVALANYLWDRKIKYYDSIYKEVIKVL